MIRVSIITVCRNSAGTIRETIESVLGQDYADLEYIVIDGASTDETPAIIREYGDRIAVVVSEPDAGIYDAMNKGLSRATGVVVGFLNSDDVYTDSGAVRRLVDKMQAVGSDTVFADLVVVDRSDTERIVRYYDSGKFHHDRLQYGWMPAHPTFLAKRELYRQNGGFRIDYRIAADFEMMVRLFHTAGASYAHLSEVVVRMRAGGASNFSLKNSWILNNEIVRACRINGLQTNLARVLLKTPEKLLELVRRPKNQSPLGI